MNNWTAEELAFRCERLSVRLEKLAQKFVQIADLSQDLTNSEVVLRMIRESKQLLELTEIDLDVDSAFELAQIQRQLSRWHMHWSDAWVQNSGFSKISRLAQVWSDRIREMTGVLV
ncbi:MAG: hypothetical protein HC936_01455 [Leptolyngbyaceae cyanobacterium SU_3_3]|nr:hypothetical protein [Leptolyngbyaceae cyanobacterium SU_3_3]